MRLMLAMPCYQKVIPSEFVGLVPSGEDLADWSLRTGTAVLCCDEVDGAEIALKGCPEGHRLVRVEFRDVTVAPRLTVGVRA